MPDPNTIPFKEASGNGHYESKQLPQDRGDFLIALGLPEFAGDVVSASGAGTVGGEVTTYWGTDGHTIKAASQTGLAKMTAGVLSSVAAPTGAVVGTTDVQTLTNKTIDSAAFTGVSSGLSKNDVGLGNVDNTSDVNKPLSAADTAALAAKEDKAKKGVVSGYAGLDTLGKVPLAQLPDAIIGASRYQGTWNAAINNPTIPPAAPANNGYYYSVSTSGSTNIDGISTWAIGDTIISNGTIWQKIPVANAVQSVNGKQGVVVINQADVGLGNVDNTSDATKNAAGATLTNKIINGASNTLSVRLNTTDVTGNLPVNKLDGGTAASATTFWRGDGHWVSPTGAGDVQGPSSSTTNDIAVFSGTTGKLIATSGRQVSDVVVGPVTATDNHIPQFSGSTGKILKDGLAAPSGAVVGTSDAQTLSGKTMVDQICSYAGVTYRPSGVLYVNLANNATTGTAEQTLITYNVPAGLLARDGDALRITSFVFTSGSAVSKTVRYKWDGVVGWTRAAGSVNFTANAMAMIYRTGATGQKLYVGTWNSDGTNFLGLVDSALLSATMANIIPFTITGTAASGSTITVVSVMIEFLPAP